MTSIQRKQNEISREYKNAGRIKECFHHKENECKGKIKQAHSIQKNGKLTVLESPVNGNLSVYSFVSASQSEDNMMEDLIAIGKKEASTFFGFCDYHDSKLFSPIENNEFDDSDEHLFLHSYRSFAHSYHLKLEEIKAWTNSTSEYRETLMRTYGKEVIDIKIKQFSALENHLVKRKNILYNSIENKEYNNLNYLIHEFEGIVPLAVSDIITPTLSFRGEIMNNSDENNLIVSQPIFTLLPEKDHSILILAAFNYDTRSSNFIDDLNDMPKYEFEKAISSIIIDGCQNTIISPKFWDRLTTKEKRLILDEYSWRSLINIVEKKHFMSRFNFFKTKYFIKKGNT